MINVFTLSEYIFIYICLNICEIKLKQTSVIEHVRSSLLNVLIKKFV